MSAFTIELPSEIYALFVTATKEHADLEKKYQQLQKQNSTLQSQVQEKEQKLQKLRTGSYIAKFEAFLPFLSDEFLNEFPFFQFPRRYVRNTSN